MAQYGNPSSGNTAPSTGYFFDNTGNSQYGTKFFASFPGGLVTEIHVYFAGNLASVSAEFCIWDGGDNLLYSSGSQGIGSGTQNIGGQAWQPYTIPGGGVYIGPNSALRIGFWTSGHVVWTYDSSGSVNYQRTGSAGNFVSGGSEGAGNFGAYIVYTPGNAWVWNGSTWVAGGLPNVYDGTNQNGGVPYVWDGTTWNQGQ